MTSLDLFRMFRLCAVPVSLMVAVLLGACQSVADADAEQPEPVVGRDDGLAAPASEAIESANPIDWSDIEEPVLRDEVVLIEEHPCFDRITEVEEGQKDELLFSFYCDPAYVGLEVGDVLVGEQYGGYLLEITALEVEDFMVRVWSEGASLGQLFASGGFHQAVHLGSQQRASIDFSGTPLYEGIRGGSNVRVSLSQGLIRLDPSLELGASFGWFSIEQAEAVLDLQMEADLELLAEISDSLELSGDTRLATYSYPFVIPAGPVTIPAVLEVDLVVGFSTQAHARATARVGVESQAQVRVGAAYSDERWTYTNQKSFDAYRTGPDFNLEGNWGAKVWARADARVMLFSAVGPTFHVDPYLRGEAEAECYDLDWAFYTGVETGVGFDLDVFCCEISKDFGPWGWETDIGGGTVALETPLGTDCDEPIGAPPGGNEEGDLNPGGGGSNDSGDAGSSAGEGFDGTSAGSCYAWDTLFCGESRLGNTNNWIWADNWMETYPVNVGSYDGPELTYLWIAETTGEVEFRLVDPVPVLVDHDIFVLEGSSGQCMSTNALDWGSNSLRFFAHAGQRYYVVIDGYGGDAGPFELALDCNP